jgi:hypothetical protein
MKKIAIFMMILLGSCSACFSGSEKYVSCSMDVTLQHRGLVSDPMNIKRYFYLNNSLKKSYDKTHKQIVSEYENGVYTLHFREEDRTERLIYNTKSKTATLYGKQRKGYYYPWVLYNGTGNCTEK